MSISTRALMPCSRLMFQHNKRATFGFMVTHFIPATWGTTIKRLPTVAPIMATQTYCNIYDQCRESYRSFCTKADNSSDKETQKSEPTAGAGGVQRVYYGTLATRMKMVKIFSLTTSIAGIAAQPILMEQGMKMGGTGMAVFLCGFAGFFTFVTPLLLHFITKKYVTEIHYNPSIDEYTATTISIILTKIETKFRPMDVTVPEVPGMFTSFLVGKKALFVDPTMFDDPEHYVRIMGYDKPIDFMLDTSSDTKTMAKDDVATFVESIKPEKPKPEVATKEVLHSQNSASTQDTVQKPNQ